MTPDLDRPRGNTEKKAAAPAAPGIEEKELAGALWLPKPELDEPPPSLPTRPRRTGGGSPPGRPPEAGKKRTSAPEFDHMDIIFLSQALPEVPYSFEAGNLSACRWNGAKAEPRPAVNLPDTGFLVKVFGPFEHEDLTRLSFVPHGQALSQFNGVLGEAIKVAAGQEAILLLEPGAEQNRIFQVRPKPWLARAVISEVPPPLPNVTTLK